MAQVNPWYMGPYLTGELPVSSTSNIIQYSSIIPDHSRQTKVETRNANWTSPAESQFSDFSCSIECQTPPPSPPLPNHSIKRQTEKNMSRRKLKAEKLSPEPSMKRVQKRPARLSQTTYALSAQQGLEKKQPILESPESIDIQSEKTPAQKMRRLIQNRVSQRNFRQRQASRRQRLEEQVEELQKRTEAYEDLLIKYEQMLRTSSESTRMSFSSGGSDFRDSGL